MKKIFSMLLFGFLSLSVSSQTAVSVAGFFPLPEQVSRGSGRTVYNFNLGWRFHRGDVAGAEAAVFDDLQWEVVSIPHSVQLMPSEASGCRNYQGIAWYRKRFVVPESTEGKDVSIHFEAAMGKQVLYLNGNKVGEHQGGYLPFSLNLTDQGVIAGDTCVVAVMVDNSNDKTFPPGKPQYTLDFSYHGGIYRDVSLISVSPIHISTTHYASSGVYVNTPEITEEKALVDICTMLSNTQAERSKIFVEHKIYSATGECVATSKKKVIVNTEREQAFNIQIVVNHPELWEIERPNLYRLQTCLWDNEVSNTFGIRTCSFSAEKGFELNGKAVKLLGTNRHQCHLGMGNALKDEMHVRDIELLHAMGGNFLRIAHYPQDEMVLAACNRLGIVTSVEIPVINTITMSQKFSDNCVEMMKEMIYQCFNSPSVCIWAYMNEIMLRLFYNSESSIKKDEYLKYLYHISKI